MMQRLSLRVLSALVGTFIAGSASAGTYATINIDDAYLDWAGVPVVDADPADNASGPDIGNTQIANDGQYLYIRNTFHNSIALSTYIALDVDENTATGYDIFGMGLIGSEVGWQNDFAFQQGTGVFNTGGGLSGDFFGGGHALLAPFANASQRELAISLSSIRNGFGPVFPDDTIRLLLWTDGGAGDVSAVISYQLAPVPEPATIAAVVGAAAVALRRRRN